METKIKIHDRVYSTQHWDRIQYDYRLLKAYEKKLTIIIGKALREECEKLIKEIHVLENRILPHCVRVEKTFIL
jgi:hypothetical protein